MSDQLAWAPPSDTGSGPGLSTSTYNVYCRANSTATWSRVIKRGRGNAMQGPAPRRVTLATARARGRIRRSPSPSSTASRAARAYWPKPSLTASSVIATGATPSPSPTTTAPTGTTRRTRRRTQLLPGPGVSTATETLTGLNGGTTYTYKAYSDSACTTARLLATAAAFTTLPPTLTASAVTTTSATLTLAGRTGDWWLKETAPSTGTCTAGESDYSHALGASALTAGTWYTYTAYSDDTCSTANELAAEAFSTAVTVGNYDTASTLTTTVGSNSNTLWQTGQAFTTGSNGSGYTLSSITGRFSDDTGSPGDIVVKLHAASGTSPGTELATLSGANPTASGAHTYTCSGSGCALAASTTYFVVMSAPNATATNHYTSYSTLNDTETLAPSSNGWSIADAAVAKSGVDPWFVLTTGRAAQIKVAALPKPSLTASSVTTATATLTLTGHAGDWWLKKTSPTPAGTCTAGESDYSHALSNLTMGTSYTYKAYSDSGCTSANEIASATFTPPPGVPTNVSVGGSSNNGTHRVYPVSWSKPANTQSTDAFAYQLQCTNQGVKTTTIWNSCGTHDISERTDASMSQNVQHGVTGGLFYYVRVRSLKNGVHSDWVIKDTEYGTS